MKLFLLFISFFVITAAAFAQGTIESKSPFSEPRYHYFLKTIILFNEYLDTDNGSYNTTQLRTLVPIGNKAWNLRFDLPLISANTDSENKTGIGDVGMGISYIPFIENQNGIALRTRVFANTASYPNFGSGKWVVMPAIFYGKYIRAKKFLWISSLEYQASFAGSENRSDVSVTCFENVMFYFFGKNWIAGDVAFRYNAILDGFQNNAFIELGRKITPTNLAYIHPSAAFGGKKNIQLWFRSRTFNFVLIQRIISKSSFQAVTKE